MRYILYQPRVNQAIDLLFQIPFKCGKVEAEMFRRKQERFTQANDGYYNLQPRFEGDL